MFSIAEQLKIVLVSPRNPLNIGAAARAMSNFGFLDLRLVNAYDLAFREARSAVGASALMASARECATVAEAVADCSLVVGTASLGHRDPQVSLRRLERGARFIKQHAAASKSGIALLFGSEKFGLSNEDLSHCHWLMRIPTRDEHESMNLGQAVAVCLYELARDGRAPDRKQEPIHTADGASVDRITDTFNDILNRSGYTNPKTAVSTELKVRRMVRRLGLSEKDAEMWLGMLRQISWKVNRGE
ncbi:MAG: TrmJ/YjtD family RNA methyltransferase [Acidobacteriota bacterium]